MRLGGAYLKEGLPGDCGGVALSLSLSARQVGKGTVGRSFFAAYNFREFRKFEAESRKLISRNQIFNSILYGKASPFAKIKIANLAVTKIVRREKRPPYGSLKNNNTLIPIHCEMCSHNTLIKHVYCIVIQ